MKKRINEMVEIEKALLEVRKDAIEEVKSEVQEYVVGSVAVLARMMPKALEVVYEVMDRPGNGS